MFLKKLILQKKYYASNEYQESIKILKDILKNDPFNYETLKLILQYTLDLQLDFDLYNNLDDIESYLNKFNTVKISEEDDSIIKEYTSRIDDILKEIQNRKKSKNLGLIISIAIIPVIFVAIIINENERAVTPNYRIEIKNDVQKNKSRGNCFNYCQSLRCF